MCEVSMETAAFAKIILHAAKYPYCAVNGLLLADNNTIKDSLKVQDLAIVETIPLFHHSHYLSPMAEIALTQVENYAQSNNRTVVGYYAACENLNDNSVEKCPGQKIADKIVEYFPSAVFIVIDNKKLMQHLDCSPLKLYKYAELKWKPKDNEQIILKDEKSLEAASSLMQQGAHKGLADFDDYLDDLSQDWRNHHINQLLPAMCTTFVK